MFSAVSYGDYLNFSLFIGLEYWCTYFIGLFVSNILIGTGSLLWFKHELTIFFFEYKMVLSIYHISVSTGSYGF